MRILKNVKGCSGLEMTWNKNIRTELNVYSVKKQTVESTVLTERRLPKQIRNCKQQRKREIEDLIKDELIFFPFPYAMM